MNYSLECVYTAYHRVFCNGFHKFFILTTAINQSERYLEVRNWRNSVSKRHGSNKLFQVWVSEETYKRLQEFLDKFSAGETSADRARNFLDWLSTQTEGIDQRIIDLKLQQTEEAKRKKEFHCFRGVLPDWQVKDPEVQSSICVACSQSKPKEFQECRRRRRELESFIPPDRSSSSSMTVSKSSEKPSKEKPWKEDVFKGDTE
jgi:hypothetical protein